jgi:hypothetical protein
MQPDRAHLGKMPGQIELTRMPNGDRREASTFVICRAVVERGSSRSARVPDVSVDRLTEASTGRRTSSLGRAVRGRRVGRAEIPGGDRGNVADGRVRLGQLEEREEGNRDKVERGQVGVELDGEVVPAPAVDRRVSARDLSIMDRERGPPSGLTYQLADQSDSSICSSGSPFVALTGRSRMTAERWKGAQRADRRQSEDWGR